MTEPAGLPPGAFALDFESQGNTVPAASRVALGPDGRLSALVISSGGTYGAYGVGILTASMQSRQWPQFDVVTGVSVGSILALIAFAEELDHATAVKWLGRITEAIDDEASFTRQVDWIYFAQGRGTPVARGIVRVIEELISPELVAAVARQHAAGRRLFVASTNLTTARPIIWDVGLLASDTSVGVAERVGHVRRAILSSTAVPAIFPSQIVPSDDDMMLHADGGIMQPFLLVGMLAQQAQQSDHRGPQIFFLENGKFEGIGTADLTPDPISVLMRTLEVGLRANLRSMLDSLYWRALADGWEVRVAVLPDSSPVSSNAGVDFSRAVLQSLFEYAHRVSLDALRKPDGITTLWRPLEETFAPRHPRAALATGGRAAD
ncbi:MAG: hypothetical protein AcusKO_45860 [Acuticoccus sp.]